MGIKIDREGNVIGKEVGKEIMNNFELNTNKMPST